MVRFPTIARARWSAVVAALRDLGFTAIDVPLVWREHERAPGVFDFETGPVDLAAMIAVVREAGLSLVVRMGPMVTDDAPGLCLPERIFVDRKFHARTRRQNPVLVPDPPRLVPLPSIASRAFRDEAVRWVRAACDAVAERLGGESPLRVIVGDGPHGLVRDDPFEADHHPDARGDLAAIEPPHDGPHEAADAEVKRESLHAVSYRRALVDAFRSSALAHAPLAVAVHGSATISPAAHELADDFAIALPSPPPTAGTMATWRQVRHAVALTDRHGAHFDLWSGGPAWYPPMRGSHTVAAARLALAAGACDVTVRMGCAGERWIGAVISDTAQSRPHAPMWRDVLAWADSLPHGEERAVDLVEPPIAVSRARAATAVHPMPLGLLALVGLTPAQLAVGAAPSGVDALSVREREDRLVAVEHALVEAGVPFRRVPRAMGELSYDGERAAEPFAKRAIRELSAIATTSEPPGSVLVRAVVEAARTSIVAVSKSDRPATVYIDGGAHELAPGAVSVFALATKSAAEKPAVTRAPTRGKKSSAANQSTTNRASRKATTKKHKTEEPT
jgi:hypothetical protein